MNVNQESEHLQAGPGAIMSRERISWNRVLLVIAILALISGFSMLYYTRNFTGSIDRHAEDIAQIARNVSEGKGFSTRIIRPFNVAFKQSYDFGMPELNSGPLYPYLMAVMFRANGVSDQTVAWTSLLFFLLTVAVTYLLGSLLFDWRAGLLAASIIGVSVPALEISISGKEWPMAALWFTLLLYVIALHHKEVMNQRQRYQLYLSCISTLPTALLYYTNHIFFFLALPVLIYLIFTGSRRLLQSAAYAVILILLISPLIYRNTVHTGSPILGASTWDIMAHTDVYPGDTLYRSADPADRNLSAALLFPAQHFSAFSEKLIIGSTELVKAGAGMLGWLALPFAVVCILYKFKKPTANSIRGMLYGVVPLLVAVSAIYGVDTGAVLIFVPAAAVFGSAYFLLLLEAKRLHPEYTKGMVIGFVFLTILPALGTTIWSDEVKRRQSVSAADQFFGINSSRLGPDIAVFTDAPWAAAWRTRSVGVWLPRTDDDAYRLMDRGIPMVLIILTPESTKFSPDEVWYVLHRIRLWRKYVEDPEKGLQAILNEDRTPDLQKENPEKYYNRINRSFAVSETIAGFKCEPTDPLAPDEIQVFIAPAETF